jgi:hypothetical protein
LAIGLDVPVNTPEALFHLYIVLAGPYPDIIKAKAASLASACYFDAFIRDSFKLKGENLQIDMATGMAEISCQFGLFPEIAYFLVEESLLNFPNKNRLMKMMNKNYPSLLRSYKEFINREGLKIAAGRVCSACWKGSVSKSHFFRCAGACEGIRKLSYCSRSCQKSVRFTLHWFD